MADLICIQTGFESDSGAIPGICEKTTRVNCNRSLERSVCAMSAGFFVARCLIETEKMYDESLLVRLCA